MSTIRSYDPSDPDKMNLQPGLTCGDCFHIHRCKAMFGHVETDTRCDWSPSRFHPSSALLARVVAQGKVKADPTSPK
jgi:hypothetical protein